MKLLALALLGCVPTAFAAFGITTSGSKMLMDTGDGLVVTSQLAFLSSQF